MDEKIKRVIEHLEYLKVKEAGLYNRLDKKGDNNIVSFGKIQGLSDAIRFIKSEYNQNLNKENQNKPSTMQNVSRSFSLDEVRNIALEYRNACMYGHSHKLTRFELQDKLKIVDEKNDLEYKEGIDYIRES